MSDSQPLRECPFCGGEGFISTVEHTPENRPNGYKFHGQIMCRKCQATAGTTGFDLTHEEATNKAIAAWNRRVDHIRDTTKKVSNADRIRSMSDEELHKFLLDFEAGVIPYAKTFCDLCCKDAALERKSTDCDGCLLWWLKNDATLPQGVDWLKQPAKEE